VLSQTVEHPQLDSWKLNYGHSLLIPALQEQLRMGGAAASPLLLDSLSVSALGAYSMSTKLRAAYAGAAYRVRRSSDSTEQDIPFSGSVVDSASLLSFVGAGSAFITTWYDQSGNGRNWTQTTAASQPRVVNAGVREVLTAGPAFFCDGSNDNLKRVSDAFGLSGSPDVTIACTFKCTGTNTKVFCVGNHAANGEAVAMFNESSTKLWIDYTSFGVPFTPSPSLATASVWVEQHAAGGAVTTGTMRQNGTSRTPGTATGAGALNITTGNGSRLASHTNDLSFCQVSFGDWMIFNSVLSGTNLTLVEAALAANL